MTGITVKLILSSFFLVGGGISVVGIHKAFQKMTIQDKLNSENKSFLNTQETKDSYKNDDDPKWEQKITSWINNESEIKTYIGIKASPTENEKKIQALKEKCKSELKEEFSEDRYEKFKKNCTENN